MANKLSEERGVGSHPMSNSSMRQALIKYDINTWTCYNPDDTHNPNRRNAECVRNVLDTEAVRTMAREGPRHDCLDPVKAKNNPIADRLNCNKVYIYMLTYVVLTHVCFVHVITGRLHDSVYKRTWTEERGFNFVHEKGFLICSCECHFCMN